MGEVSVPFVAGMVWATVVFLVGAVVGGLVVFYLLGRGDDSGPGYDEFAAPDYPPDDPAPPEVRPLHDRP